MDTIKSSSDFIIIDRLNECKQLPVLRSLNTTLLSLIDSETSFMSQIAEVIGRDPAITTKLLNLANSIFFGFAESQPIKSIEEAAFYVGLTQLKHIIITTPVVEDLLDLQYLNNKINWVDFWTHSVATAILTREVLSLAEIDWDDESDYIAGLLHNVGKIVIATVFPEEFSKMLNLNSKDTLEFCEEEKKAIEWDHAKIGAYFLWKNHLAADIIEAVQNHNSPYKSLKKPELAAAIQLADHLARSADILGIESTAAPIAEEFQNLDGFMLLFGHMSEEDQNEALLALSMSKERIASTIKEMI